MIMKKTRKNNSGTKTTKNQLTQTRKSTKKLPETPKTYLTINKKVYRAINPEKALEIAKKLGKGNGKYKVHVIYGKEQISKRKVENVENIGKYATALEAKQAIEAFLDKSLWLSK